MTSLVDNNIKTQSNRTPLRVLQPSYRIYLLGLIGMVSMVVMLWAPFGLKRPVGLYEEWLTLRHPSDASVFLITHDPTRPFSFAAFVFAQALLPNSFVGQNLFMMLLFILKGTVVYKLLYRLVPQDRFLAFLTASLFIIYPADTGLMTFRALNIHTSIALGLLSIYLLVAQWQQPQKWHLLGIVVLQFISLGDVWHNFGSPSAAIGAGKAYYTPPHTGRCFLVDATDFDGNSRRLLRLNK